MVIENENLAQVMKEAFNSLPSTILENMRNEKEIRALEVIANDAHYQAIIAHENLLKAEAEAETAKQEEGKAWYKLEEANEQITLAYARHDGT